MPAGAAGAGDRAPRRPDHRAGRPGRRPVPARDRRTACRRSPAALDQGGLRARPRPADRHRGLERPARSSPCRRCRAAGSPAPDTAGFGGFAGRYQARFGSEPAAGRHPRLRRGLAHGGAARQYGSQRFADTTLTNRVRLLRHRRHLPLPPRRAQRPGARGLRDPQRRGDRRQPGPAHAGQARHLNPPPRLSRGRSSPRRPR